MSSNDPHCHPASPGEQPCTELRTNAATLPGALGMPEGGGFCFVGRGDQRLRDGAGAGGEPTAEASQRHWPFREPMTEESSNFSPPGSVVAPWCNGSTLDSESSNPSSILGGASHIPLFARGFFLWRKLWAAGRPPCANGRHTTASNPIAVSLRASDSSTRCHNSPVLSGCWEIARQPSSDGG